MRTAIGVDLGGTKIAAGLVDEAGRILERAQVPTSGDQESILEALSGVAEKLGASSTEGVGVGAAGMVNFETGYYLYAPNVAMGDVDLAEVISKATGCRVVVDNDANVACWGEHRFGAGRGTRHFLMVTLGTGIGGGLVVDGKPFRGAHGGAGEIGHMLVDAGGPVCGCGARGCWEAVASGTALTRMAAEQLRPGSSVYELAGGNPQDVDGRMVTDAAREGDEFALELCRELGRWIGLGIASLINILEPEKVAIAGGLSEDWDLFSQASREAVAFQAEAASQRQMPAVVRAQLGPEAGIVGAASLVLYP